MDIAFYALVALAAAVLVLAMWSCAARGVNEWGPDLTPELLPYLIQEQIRLQHKQEADEDEEAQKPRPHSKHKKKIRYAAPSAPSDSAGAPLLSNAQPMGHHLTPKRPAPPPPPPPKPKKLVADPVFKNTVVRVLPAAECIRYQQLRPTVHRFSTEEPV